MVLPVNVFTTIQMSVQIQSCRCKVKTYRFACLHEDEGPSVGWTPFGCCSRRGYGRPPTACRQRSGAAGQEECLPCPESSTWRCRLYRWTRPQEWWSCRSLESNTSVCERWRWVVNEESGVNSRVLTKICMIAGMRWEVRERLLFADVGKEDVALGLRSVRCLRWWGCWKKKCRKVAAEVLCWSKMTQPEFTN